MMWSEYLRMMRAQPEAVQQLVLAFAQMQRDFGAALRPFDRSRSCSRRRRRIPSARLLGGAGRRGA